MPNVIYNPATNSVQSPIVFSKENAIDIIGLDPTYLILEKVFVTPEYNTETEQSIESWTIDLPNLQYVQTWTIEPIVFQPDWAGFLAPFSIPTAGGIYHSILSKLELSTMGTIDHWTNVKMGLTNAEIRSPEWLVPSWNGLKLMLAADGNPLSEETIAEAEALMAQYHLLP